MATGFMRRTMEASSSTSSAHADTLLSRKRPGWPARTLTLSRYLVAQLLGGLSHSEKALPIARAIASAMDASPSWLGSAHPPTVSSCYLVALLLDRLGSVLRAILALPHERTDRRASAREHGV
jgi:hypothetical protein